MRLRCSVVIPAYRAGGTLKRALDSLVEQSPVSHPLGDLDLEVIVVVDGLTGSADHRGATQQEYPDDGTLRIAEAHPVVTRVLVNEHTLGPSAARNRGVSVASGDVLAYLDADDRWTKQSLSRRVEALGRTIGPHIVQGRFAEVPLELDEQRLAAGRGAESELPSSRLGTLVGTWLVTRAAHDIVGPFDERMRVYEDMDWWGRAETQGVPVTKIEDVTLVYRRHGNSLTGGGKLRSEVFAALRARTAARSVRTRG